VAAVETLADDAAYRALRKMPLKTCSVFDCVQSFGLGTIASMNMRRNRAVEDFLHWRGALADLIHGVRDECASPVRVLDRVIVAAALEKVVAGLVEPGEISLWAQTVHFREDVEVEEGHEDLLTQFLFEISTPELFEAVTPDLCHRWLDRLRASLAMSPVVGP